MEPNSQNEAEGEKTAGERVIGMRELFREERVEALLAEAARLAQGGFGKEGVRVSMSLAVLLSALIGGGFALALAGFLAADKTGYFGMTLFLVGSYAAGAMVLFERWESRDTLLERIARHNDVLGVGPLIEALTWHDRGIQRAARRALIRLLPQMHASDASVLTARQRERLFVAMTGSSVDLTLAALRALEQIGDHHALPVVEALATGRSQTARRDWRVQEAAQACLPFLRLRAEQHRASQTLLRASGISEVSTDGLVRPADPPEDNLLRPAKGVVEVEAQELLRPPG